MVWALWFHSRHGMDIKLLPSSQVTHLLPSSPFPCWKLPKWLPWHEEGLCLLPQHWISPEVSPRIFSADFRPRETTQVISRLGLSIQFCTSNEGSNSMAFFKCHWHKPLTGELLEESEVRLSLRSEGRSWILALAMRHFYLNVVHWDEESALIWYTEINFERN